MGRKKEVEKEEEEDFLDETYETTDLEPDLEIPEDVESDIKIPAILSFMSQFQNKGDYSISVYKAGDRSKGDKFNKEFLETIHNELPDLESLRDKWGGGKFIFFVKTGTKTIVCPTVNIAAPPVKPSTITSENFSKKDVIGEMREMATLLQSLNPSGGNNATEMFSLIMKMQEGTNRLFEKMSDSQRESERRMTELVMSQNKQGNSLQEAVGLIKVVNDLKGEITGESGDSNPVMNMLTPIIEPLVAGIATKFMSEKTEKKPEIIPTQKIEYKTDINATVEALPSEFKKSVTLENKVEMINHIYQKNSTVLSYEECRDIIDIILFQNSQVKAEQN